jgi:hypothetical protein
VKNSTIQTIKKGFLPMFSLSLDPAERLNTSTTQTLPPSKRPLSSIESLGITEAIRKAEEGEFGTTNSTEKTSCVSPTKKRKMEKLPESQSVTSAAQSILEATLPAPGNIWKTPPTPMKARRPNSAPSPYSKLCNQIEHGSCMICNQRVKVAIFSKQGSYMNVYTIQAVNPVITTSSNDQLLLKVYNQKRSSESEKRLNSYMEHSIQNYRDAQELGLPVATIYNIETALTDHFFLQEKIPGVVDLRNKDHVEQVRKFFIAALKNNLSLDVLPSNLMVKTEGTVVLIDFVEESENEENQNGTYCFIRQAIENWCRQFISEYGEDRATFLKFYDDFILNFEKFGFQPDSHEEILKTLFFTPKNLDQ